MLAFALVAGAVFACTDLLASHAFVPAGGARRSVLIGGLAAAVAAISGQKPANARANFSFFGLFGDQTSDPYNRDADQNCYSPYSDMRTCGMDDPRNLYKINNEEKIAEKKLALRDSYNRIIGLRPEIEKKHFYEVKSATTLQAQTMRSTMDYLARASGKEAEDLVVKVKEHLGELGGLNYMKETEKSLVAFDLMATSLDRLMDVLGA